MNFDLDSCFIGINNIQEGHVPIFLGPLHSLLVHIPKSFGSTWFLWQSTPDPSYNEIWKTKLCQGP